jgi:hypothetical protein
LTIPLGLLNFVVGCGCVSVSGRSSGGDGSNAGSSTVSEALVVWRPLNRRSRRFSPLELRLLTIPLGLLNFGVGCVGIVSVSGSTNGGGGSDAGSPTVSEAVVAWRPLQRRSRLDFLGVLTRPRALRLFHNSRPDGSLDSVLDGVGAVTASRSEDDMGGGTSCSSFRGGEKWLASAIGLSGVSAWFTCRDDILLRRCWR